MGLTKPERENAGQNYHSADFEPPNRWSELVTPHPRLGEVRGKIFLGKFLNLTGMEASLGHLPPGRGIPFLHSHKQNEELYFFLSGTGEMQVDGVKIPIRPGTAIRIAPAGVRSWRNAGDEPMSYIVIQAKAGSLEQATGSDADVPSRPVEW
jgi:mannose-6-phosphate isomerase-like protein (cupin superfamily)